MKLKIVVTLTLTLALSAYSFAQTAQEFYDQGMELLYNGKPQEALKKMEKAIELDAQKTDYFCGRADCYYELQDYQKAYDDYTYALFIDPKSSSAYNSRGNFLTSIQANDEAILDYNSAVQYCTDDTLKYGIIVNRGVAYLLKSDLQNAAADLESAVAFNPKDEAALINLSTVYGRMGRSDDAFKTLYKAYELNPTEIGIIANLGFQCQVAGKYQESLEFYNKVVELDPKQALGYSNRSYAKLMLGDTKGALSDVNKSLQLYPDNSYAFRNRAMIYIAQEKMDKACEDINKALELQFTKNYGNDVLELQKKHCLK